MDQEEGRIEGDKNIMEYITNYYKKLFGHLQRSTISLDIDNPRMVPRDAADKLTT